MHIHRHPHTHTYTYIHTYKYTYTHTSTHHTVDSHLAAVPRWYWQGVEPPTWHPPVVAVKRGEGRMGGKGRREKRGGEERRGGKWMRVLHIHVLQQELNLQAEGGRFHVAVSCIMSLSSHSGGGSACWFLTSN